MELKSTGGLKQYHLGIVILLADFVHLLYDSSPDKCLKICEIIIPAYQKERLVTVMVKLGSLKSVLNTPHVI